MRRKRLLQIFLGIVASIVALLVFVAWPGKSTFTVSPETTYVIGPLDKKGNVDYVTALNERLGQGIIPQNNANVLIWQALGPHLEGGTMPAEYFKWLGIESPPEQGDYMVGWQNYAKEHVKKPEAKERDAYQDPFFKATDWPWTAKEKPELAAWLLLNEKPLAVVMQATRRSDYFNPLVPKKTEDSSPGLMGALLPQVQKCRELATALTCRAMLRVSDGKTEEAWQDLLTCHRLGRLMTRGGTMIEMLVGIAIEQIANKADVAFLDHAELTSKQILACLQDIRNLPPMPALADEMDLGERFMCLDMMLTVARHGVSVLDNLEKSAMGQQPGAQDKARWFTSNINWDPALRNANSWIDRFVAALHIKDRPTRTQELATLNQDLRHLKQQIASTDSVAKALAGSTSRGELMGNILITLTLPAFDKVQDAVDRCEQGQSNLQLAFALAAYKADHSRYPAKLDELAPKYLPTIPDDLFSDKPLIYQPAEKGYLLYSVGLNGKDDGGLGNDDEPRGDDIRVRMPVSEPRVKE
jgi:hypothetical protein